MKHQKCGGVMLRIKKVVGKVVYQCNRCGKILTLYHRTATGGNQAKEK